MDYRYAAAHDNFGGQLLSFTRALNTSVPGAPRDYVMQTDPEVVAATSPLMAAFHNCDTSTIPQISLGDGGNLPQFLSAAGAMIPGKPD